MVNMNISRMKRNGLILVLISLVIIIVMIDILDYQFSDDIVLSNMINNTTARILGGTVFSIIIISIGHKVFNAKRNTTVKSIIIMSPALLISIYNFPFIAHFSGNAMISKPIYYLYYFIIECISVGFFEEVVFRGFLLVLLIQLFPKNKVGLLKSIIISAAIFGLIHMVNLFAGANLANTFLQIGYSFLVGLLWAVVFVKTKSIWFGVVLHAIYNFAGLVFFQFGEITNNADVITIITTTILAIGVAIYMAYIFNGIKQTEIDDLHKSIYLNVSLKKT